MSLKEWKDNELNTLLMKKWGLLSEGSDKEHEDEEGNRPSDDKKMDLDEAGGKDPWAGMGVGHHGQSCNEAHPEETAKAGGDPSKGHGLWLKTGGPERWKKQEYSAPAEEMEESHIDLARSRGQLHKALSPEDYEDRGSDPALARAYGAGPKSPGEVDLGRDRVEIPAFRDPDEPPPPGKRVRDPRHLTRTTAKVPPVSGRGLEEVGAGDWAEMADEEDPTDLPPGNIALDRQAMAQANKGARVSGKKLGKLGAAGGRRRRPSTAGSKNVFTTEGQTSGKISVREAKQITRRIIERIRKEGK